MSDRNEGSNRDKMDIREKLKNLPQKSGVYIFRDEFNRIIYIGKANVLRNRVRQYFQKSSQDRHDVRRMWLRKSIADLDYIVVNTPKEALILEANLIKLHRPFFNIRMKDDKRYPCIEITMYEEYPRIRFVRKPENRNSRYFGPYPNSGAMRRAFKLVQKAFKVRTCKYDLDKPLQRPCLDCHINLCPGPCVRQVTSEEYRKLASQACKFLDGRTDELVKDLQKDLEESSENLNFERCIVIRDMLQSVEYVTSRRPVVTKIGDDADFIGIARGDEQASLALLQVRDGKILGQLRYAMEVPMDVEDGEVVRRLIQQHYQPGFFIPPLICVSAAIEEPEDLLEWLADMRGKKVEIKEPRRGERKSVLDLAMMNASEYLKMEMKAFDERLARNREALEDLRKILGLREIPRRIEGFDISNISGQMATASMVVFVDGEPYKDHYRRFKIKQEGGPDDFAMMNEALGRRFKNFKFGELESFREKPDVMMIDGGKGQLSAVMEAASAEEITGINIISLAKKEEEVFVPGLREPLRTDPNSPGMKLLRRVRDEAHRFAVSYHRTLRKKNMEVSILDGIPGVSKRRKETLLEHFDSVEDIAAASLYELQELPGFNRKVAENVLRFLGTAK